MATNECFQTWTLAEFTPLRTARQGLLGSLHAQPCRSSVTSQSTIWSLFILLLVVQKFWMCSMRSTGARQCPADTLCWVLETSLGQGGDAGWLWHTCPGPRLCTCSGAGNSEQRCAWLLCAGVTPNHLEFLLLWQH